MNLQDLAATIRTTSADPDARKLADFLLAWRADNTTAKQLAEATERLIGHTWIQDEKEHNAIYAMWSDFRRSEIDAIDGMTMNERLFVFSLFERFDAAQDEEERRAIYKKLLASPDPVG